ncbi:uncharacterized protein PV07_04744 [Cladophialophora immunda]|uniref:Uncharacterized protein n=1 Tax=Cladophialophora immunda TaxID=569365 RepID=A0A0D2CZ93_9EURO|nr:uncharacterized protein PV07_04744 [Cladophialophora immunda]KIW28889.1 hypothetical protein PV07_04744 [Cladophialophora immunda]OQV11118.1 hypothetical protein CLAIMM_15013 [Cladophialophora immunda]
MSQHDAFENPIPITTFRPIRARSCSPVSPFNKLLQSCYAEGISKASDTDTPGIQSHPSVLPSPFHRRLSTLSRDEYQVESLAPEAFANAPVFDDSPETTLAEGNKRQITEIEASQKQEDGVRMTAHSDRRAREKIIRCDWERDHAEELRKKSHCEMIALSSSDL